MWKTHTAAVYTTAVYANLYLYVLRQLYAAAVQQAKYDKKKKNWIPQYAVSEDCPQVWDNRLRNTNTVRGPQ